MTGPLATIAVLLLAAVVLRVALAVLVGELDEWRTYRALARLARRLRRTPVADEPAARRPIEEVGADLRRLNASFHRGDMRFAKYEGCRQAYDGVLAEAADMAGLAHLMEVLPPGPELDRERQRVEMLLQHHGLLPPPYAA
ncbi:hypothetical protein GCM10009641_75830 [Mycobacterium cookii]|uniref:DUF4129 domain-containing protein n=1 Tax=Nocardioides furvisabuli TaxID=375542 RepID=A0ABP5IU56_9ACTN|nr:hypothetical protein [Nocardioides furvisabuli]